MVKTGIKTLTHATLFALLLSGVLVMNAQETNSLGTNATLDLANRATKENLPQVSAAVLRTQIQQEQDIEKRMGLTRRLVALLIVGGRYNEALAISSTVDVSKDPVLAYWKAQALLGTADYAGAEKIFSSLPPKIPADSEITSDQVTLGLARALRGEMQIDQALKALDGIPLESSFFEDATLERASDLLTLGRQEECLKLLKESPPSSDEGKAMAAYLKALLAWRTGNIDEARKLFIAVPPATYWTAAASTLGASLCSSSSGMTQQGIDHLEKHLNAVDDDPLLKDQFILLDQLYVSAGTADTTMLRRWSEGISHPARAKLASYYLAKSELRLKHTEAGEIILDAFIRKYPDDPFADQARVMMGYSKLQHGDTAEAFGWAGDRPSAPATLRAKLAYLRGLSAAASGKSEDAKSAFQSAASLDPKLAKNALFNNTVLIATTDRGSLDVSDAAKSMVALDAGLPSEEMQFQIALDLARRGQPSGVIQLGQVADQSSDPLVKSRARLAASEWNMESGKGEAATIDLGRAVHEISGDPEREEYLNVFLKDTGRKADVPGVIAAARAFLKVYPDSKFVPEVRLKLAETLLSSGDVQAARVEFEQLAFAGSGTESGRRALFLAAQSAARAMDPASLDDSLMLLERVAEHDSTDQLVWQARLQQGALKNAQNLPLEALAIYDKIITSTGPDIGIRAATLMTKADTLHQLGSKDPSREREALESWRILASDPSMPLRWRNQALCKSGLVLEKLGEGDTALAMYYQAFKNPRADEPESLWHDKAAFEAGRLLESRRQWKDAVTLYNQVADEGGPRADEAKARISKLRLENFLWEN